MRRKACAAPPRPKRRRTGGRGSREAGGSPRFVVQETEEAALLLVPAEGPAGRRGARRKRGGGAEPGAAGSPGGDWGSRLPAELLVRVFALAAASEGGAVPFLCRAARVCRLWCRASAAPVLWQRVAVGHCWAAPGQKWVPAQQQKALGTLEWLAAHRFSLLRDFTLSHWKSLVPSVLQALAAS
ncbi:F-box/LRR-repeat protein 6-like, partial [Pseudonaja textilis]|uniref:F-box/LRR-repeat protein 6-like n=1 Tax=Pseudonaja textilis TaxID=8673 RepID=UPI000EA87E05